MLFEHDGHDGEEEQLQEVVPAAVPFPAPPTAEQRRILAHSWSKVRPGAETCDKTGQRSAPGGSHTVTLLGGQVTMCVSDVYSPHLVNYLSRRRCVAMMGDTEMLVAGEVDRFLREATTSSRPNRPRLPRKVL